MLTRASHMHKDCMQSHGGRRKRRTHNSTETVALRGHWSREITDVVYVQDMFTQKRLPLTIRLSVGRICGNSKASSRDLDILCTFSQNKRRRSPGSSSDIITLGRFTDGNCALTFKTARKQLTEYYRK